MEHLATVAAFAASLVAVIAALAGITKGPRLRRQEQLLREVLPTLESRSAHHATVSEVHRAIVSELLIRQLHGAWRFTWPFLTWIAIGATCVQIGHDSARYLSERTSDAPFNALDYLFETTEQAPETLMFLVLYAFAISPAIFFKLLQNSMHRAKSISQFHATGIAQTPGPSILEGSEIELWTESTFLKNLRHLGALILAWMKLWGPGMATIGLGFLVGTTIGDRTDHSGQRAVDDPAVSAVTLSVFLTILVLVVGMGLTFCAVLDLQIDRKKYSVPKVHPTTAEIVFERPARSPEAGAGRGRLRQWLYRALTGQRPE